MEENPSGLVMTGEWAVPVVTMTALSCRCEEPAGDVAIPASPGRRDDGKEAKSEIGVRFR